MTFPRKQLRAILIEEVQIVRYDIEPNEADGISSGSIREFVGSIVWTYTVPIGPKNG
jgi:hypothetical protein